MLGAWENHTIRRFMAITGLFTLLTIGQLARAENQPDALQLGIEPPAGWKSDSDHLYQDIFSRNDARLSNEHRALWGNEFHSLSTLSRNSPTYYGHAYEKTVREQLAQKTLRVRLDGAIKSYFEHPDRARGIKEAKKTLDAIKNLSVRLSKNEQSSVRLRLGYDVFTNSSHFEYSSNSFLWGFYQTDSLDSLLGQNSKLDTLSTRVSTNFGLGLPTTSVRYFISAEDIEASISKPLSDSVTTEIVSKQPLTDKSTLQSYELRLIYSF